MTKLKNYNSFEGKVLKEIFQDSQIDPYIALIVESYIYKEIITYHKENNLLNKKTSIEKKFTRRYKKVKESTQIRLLKIINKFGNVWVDGYNEVELWYKEK